jgi:hypothetical protein
MAFNWKTFKTRALTAIIFAAVNVDRTPMESMEFFNSYFHYPYWLLAGIF